MKKRNWTNEERSKWLKEHNKLFYCNKEDASLFIRKQHGIAWTLNWGNLWSYVIIAVGIVGLIYMIFYS